MGEMRQLAAATAAPAAGGVGGGGDGGDPPAVADSTCSLPQRPQSGSQLSVPPLAATGNQNEDLGEAIAIKRKPDDSLLSHDHLVQRKKSRIESSLGERTLPLKSVTENHKSKSH